MSKLHHHVSSLKASLARFELLRPFLTSQNTLLQRAARGGGWLLAMQLGKKLLTVGQTLILARLLLPQDFGLFGIVLIAVSFVEILNQVAGFQTALVQKQGERRVHLDTTWTILVGQGCFNGFVLLALSKPISTFFGEPRAAPLIQVFSITLLLHGFVNIGIIYFQKELQFYKQFTFTLLETFVGVAVAVSVALLTRSVWALVIGAIAGATTRLVSSFLLHDYRPSFKFDWPSFRELFTFGGWVWLSSMIFFFQSQGDNLVVGKVLGVALLGFYRVAYSIANLAGTEVGNIFGRIMLPVYAKLQDDPVNLKAVYLKLTHIQTLIILPIAVGMITLAPEFVRVALGEVWLPATPVLQILVGFSALNAMVRRAEVLLEGKGLPQHGTIGRSLFLLVGGGLIYPLALWLKLPGVAIAVVGGVSAGWLYVEYQAAKILSLRAIELMRACSANLLAVSGMGALLVTLKAFIPTESSLLLLFILAPLGGVGYLLFIMVADHIDFRRIRSFAKSG